MITLVTLLAMDVSCSKEGRTLASVQPQTPPTGVNDPRISAYADNVYQVSQGSRYFIWYGCGTCHGHNLQATVKLDNQRIKGASLATIYGFLTNGHASKYSDKIPVEQLW